MTWRNLLFVTLATFTLACSTDKSADETGDEPPTEAETAERDESEQTPREQKQDEAEASELEVAAELQQAPGNITVTPEGQEIVSLHQFYQPQMRVATVGEDGSLEPFPNEEWSVGTDGDPPRLDAVLGLQSTPEGVVWLLDNGLRNDRTPKLVGWDTRADELVKVIELGDVTPDNEFVNDLAVDTDTDTIYIADPAGGDNAALIVVDIESGEATRVLEGHESTIPEDIDLVIDGDPVESKGPDGETVRPRVGADPIALDADNEWLYYGPMHGETMYRVPAETLREGDSEAISEAVESYAEKPICDGISIDEEDNIYISDIANDAVGIIPPEGEYRILVQDDRLEWPDAFSFGPDGMLYTVANQLHKSAPLNAGEETAEPPFYIFELDTPAEGVVGR